MKKTIILFSIIVLLFNLQASGQDVAPALTPLINGSGTTYGSLKKIPKPCATAVGNFYVSTADDHNGILCYPGGQTTTTYYDGLTNTKNWISQIYGLSFSSMPTGISTYSTIMTPNSAPAVCFRKNYGSTGALVPGTTLANMWYLPSHMELFLIYQYVAASSSAFTGVLMALIGQAVLDQILLLMLLTFLKARITSQVQMVYIKSVVYVNKVIDNEQEAIYRYKYFQNNELFNQMKTSYSHSVKAIYVLTESCY